MSRCGQAAGECGLWRWGDLQPSLARLKCFLYRSVGTQSLASRAVSQDLRRLITDRFPGDLFFGPAANDVHDGLNIIGANVFVTCHVVSPALGCPIAGCGTGLVDDRS